MTNFPANPTHGTIYQYAPGSLYQYDATINAWVAVASSNLVLPTATTIKPGAMSASDFKKLNRLVLPPPFATITGNDCVAPFTSGGLTLTGDDFVEVSGNLDLISGNEVDQFEYHIHEHTYGFDFKVNLEELVNELTSRDQFNIRGVVGDRGPDGVRGDPGESNVAAGPRGITGDPGSTPACPYNAELEPLAVEVKQGLQKALVAARVVIDPDDDTKYSLEFDRQTIGADTAAYKFFVRQQNSAWVLAVTSGVGTPQALYYINLAPIIEAIREKFLSEVERLRAGYEDVVQFWVQTMSDLFDEQKRALCCALEYCQSKTKNIALRQHLELTAATIAGTGKIVINNRDSDEVVESSGTELLSTLPDGADLCAASSSAARAAAAPEFITVTLDPITNVRPENGVKLDLNPGEYTVIVDDMAVQINNKHFMPVAIRYNDAEQPRSVKFLNKGQHDTLAGARDAYNGLALSFKHFGGQVAFYFNMLPSPKASGLVQLSLSAKPLEVIPKAAAVSDQTACVMDQAKLEWYFRGWNTNRCCGCVVNVGGQDYIVMKRSIGADNSCGGGEQTDAACITAFAGLGHPAFAWPTLDGKTPIPASGAQTFLYDRKMSELVVSMINANKYFNQQGDYRQLTVVLFPANGN